MNIKDAFTICQSLGYEKEVDMFEDPAYAKWDKEMEEQFKKEFGDNAKEQETPAF